MHSSKQTPFSLPCKTQLRAGTPCKWDDTNCAAVDKKGNFLTYQGGKQVFNSCNNFQLLSGANCEEWLKIVKRDYGVTGGTCIEC